MRAGEPPGAALVRAYLAAGDAHDVDELRRTVTPDVVTWSPGGAVTRHADALIGTWTTAHAGLRDLHHEVREVYGGGDDHVAARVRVTGVHTGPFLGIAATGATLDVDQGLFVRLRSGRIAEMWEIVDTGLALRQLGVLGDQPLSPEPPGAA